MDKRCTLCKETKPLDEFSIDRYRPDGRDRRCRPCRRFVEREAARAKRIAEGREAPPTLVPVGATIRCASCDEGEHDTCLRILRPAACTCTCPADGNLVQPPMPASTFLVCGLDIERRGVRADAPPWSPVLFCSRHHELEGKNTFYDRAQRAWVCRLCRRNDIRRTRAAASQNP